MAKDKWAGIKNRSGINKGQCYYNAYKAVQYVPEYAEAVYVEGIVVSREGLMLEHGWVECGGEVIDPTLPAEDLLYFPGLRCEGQHELDKLMGETQSVGVPLFYAFGWGGKDHAGFREARRLAMAYSESFIAKTNEKMPHESGALSL